MNCSQLDTDRIPSTYFYKNAGLPTSQAFNLSLAQYGLGFVGTIGSWTLMSYFGRRTLYLYGLVGQCVIMAIIGGLGFAPANATIVQQKRQSGITIRVNKGASWGVGSLLLVFTFWFDCTVGPVCYAIVGESSSTRLRQKTIVLARMLYNICGIINNVLTPVSHTIGAIFMHVYADALYSYNLTQEAGIGEQNQVSAFAACVTLVYEDTNSLGRSILVWYLCHLYHLDIFPSA